METTDKRVGRYILLEPLGRGGMGTVYRAEDPFIHRTVAVKVLRPDAALTPELVDISRERFRREAEAAGRIDHPNVIRIFDVGEDEASGDMYLVMEFAAGPSLEKLLHEGGFSLERGVAIIGQIAAGLDAAHRRGILHRDIKPSNVLFTDEGLAKIVDFGITRIGSSVLTQDTKALGTPAYMSPEQAHGHDVDARSDLFSLGVVSYEILAGKKPFDGSNAVSVAYAIAHLDALPISRVNPSLPAVFDAPFDRMLSKDPVARFPRGKEFSEELRGCLETPTARVSTPASTPKPRTGLLLRLLGATALAAALTALVLSPGKELSVGDIAKPQPAIAIAPPAAQPKANPKVKLEPPKREPPKSEPPKPEPPKPEPPKPEPPKPEPPKPEPAVARPTVSKADVTIRLAHRIREGTLVVSLDGAPIFIERFSKAKLALQQTTTWDTFQVPAGMHELTARVDGENGKIYRLEPHQVEIARTGNTMLRIGFKRDRLTVVSSPAER